MPDPSDPNSYTVGWVCALPTEFTAAQEQFDIEYGPQESPAHRETNDFNLYSFGKINGHMVVVAVLPNGQYGTASAATVAKDMIRSFRNIRFGLMVGTGGGAPTQDHDIRLGDVVVSSPTPGQGGVFQYDFGKATKDGLQHTASHNKPPQLLLTAVAGLQSHYERNGLRIRDKVDAILEKNGRLRLKYGYPEVPDFLFAASVEHKSDPCHESCAAIPTDLVLRMPRQEPMEDVEVHYGTIASGNTLMKNAASRDEFASKADILCFEMEAAGLMDGFRCLIIRGICDYCDSHKNDKWQGYAAMTAAVYAKQILGMIRPEAVTREETIVSKIDEVISGVENLKRSIANQDVLDWLSDEDFGSYQFDEHSKMTRGTCEWFLNSAEYQSWTQERGKVLFCQGIAGAGKSVLASAIIEKLHSRHQKNSSTATAHIYCRYNRRDRQNFSELQASLLRQLCERLSPLPESIMQLYDQYKPRRVKAPPEKILSGLESVAGLFSKVFVVVDALDEWATEHGDLYSLPAELLLLRKRLGINLLVTSRPIPLISNQFKDYPSISISAQQQDIYVYVDKFPWPESSCIGKIAELRSLVKQVMSQIVKGMFLLARLYLNSLVNETSERDVKDALQRFEDRAENNDDNPKFSIVDQAYNDTFERLKEQHQNSSDLAFRVLAWICCTSWKLPAGAIQEGLALREGDTTFHEDGIVDEKLLVSVCCGLVDIPEGSKEIRLVHYTAEGFFQHNRHLLDKYFLERHSHDYGLPSNADEYLARQCFTCLSIGLPKYPPSRPGQLYNTRDQKPYRRILDSDFREFPLYAYSAFNWGGHVRRLSPLDQTYKTSLDLLRTPGIFDEAAEMILHIGSWRVRPKAPKELSSWHLAALFGLSDLAESLTESPDIDARDNCGRTALVWAMECFAFGFQFKPRSTIRVIPSFDLYLGIDKDRCRVVKALLASGASPHMLEDEGRTTLHLAAILGDVEIIETLLEYGASPDASDRNGDVPLILALRYGGESAYMALLKGGSVDICGKNSRTALIEAASVGNLASAKKLIGKGAKVDHSDKDGQTALMKASKHGHSWLVELLLENRSEVNHQDHKGDTALIKACIGDHTDIIGLLLAANARLDIKDGRERATIYAGVEGCREGTDSIRLLLDHSTDPNNRDQRYGATLVHASSLRRLEIVSLILEDAAFKPTQEHLDLALSMSCKEGNEKVVRLLIDHGANPNRDLDEGRVSLELLTRAISFADDAVVLTLLDAHINVQCVDRHGEGPMHAAAARGTKATVDALIRMGVSVNDRTPGGKFPLDFAMRRQDNDTSIADLLKKHGAITERRRLVKFMQDRIKRLE